MQYIVIYIEILVLCFITAFLVHWKTGRDLGTNWEIGVFKWMLRVFMLMMIIDAFTQLHYQRMLDIPRPVVAFLYATYMWCLSGLMGMFWFFFAELRMGATILRKRWVIVLAVIPCVAMFLLCYGSLINGAVFSFDDTGIFVRGPLFFVQNVFVYLYFLATTVHAMVLAMDANSPIRRHEMLTLASFMIPPLIGGFLQLVIGGYPMVAPAVLIAILYIFLTIQGDLVNYDTLTGINNRKSMDRYLEDTISRATESTPFYLFMMDLNKFKHINDTLGHLEGDRALRVFAEALRAVETQFHGFAGRYGGDEFMLLVDARYAPEPSEVSRYIDEQLQKRVKEAQLSYELTVSTGYAKCSSASTRPHVLTEQADRMLYAKKPD